MDSLGRTNMDDKLYQSGKFQSWRRDILGFYEDAFSKSLDVESEKILDWTFPNRLILYMKDSILAAYSPIPEIQHLLSKLPMGEAPSNEEIEKKRQVESFILDSLLEKRLSLWYRSVLWITTAAYYGAYESVARELRFIVEDCVQAYIVDMRIPYDEYDGRVESSIMKDELRGGRLIDEAKLPDDLTKNLKDIYYTLCDYVHPSMKIIKAIKGNSTGNFEYDEDMFHQAYNWHRTAFDLVFVLVLSKFPKAIRKLEKNFDIRQDLTHYNYEETLKFISNDRF